MSKLRLTPICSLGKSLVEVGLWKALRPAELGLIQFCNAPNARKFAEANCRRLAGEGLLIARKLPLHAGQIFVLSRAGAERVSWWMDGKFHSGKDFGETKNGAWTPPASWRHDLLATGLLAHLRARGWVVRPDIAVRREAEKCEKYPDGLLLDPVSKKSYWMETEQAEKKGENMKNLVRALLLAARGRPVVAFDSWSNHPANSAMVAIQADSRDGRGYRIAHLDRIKNALLRYELKAPVELTIAWLKLRGAGVAGVELEKIIVKPSEN